MKYCAKCGTPMSDDAMVCPQCHPEVNNKPTQNPSPTPPSKTTSSKSLPLILANMVISLIMLIVIIIMYFMPPTSSGSVSNNNVFNSTCPADEYGYHDWSPARCTQPSHCYECGAYRDDKLGEHDFDTDDNGLCSCWYCGILYEVYINSLD